MIEILYIVCITAIDKNLVDSINDIVTTTNDVIVVFNDVVNKSKKTITNINII